MRHHHPLMAATRFLSDSALGGHMRTSWKRKIGGLALIGLWFAGGTIEVTVAAPPVKETLASGNWDRNLPSSSRFTILAEFGNAAARDNNTGLVWEREPDNNNRPWTGSVTTSASSYCASKIVGGTAGWRLPSVIELKSVQDPSLPTPFVPPSVFTGVQSAPYWSSTSVVWTTGLAWHVYFHSGLVDEEPITSTNLAWCVRGPMNADAY
jgi:hypothetical protein